MPSKSWSRHIYMTVSKYSYSMKILLIGLIFQCSYLFSQTNADYFSFIEAHFERSDRPDTIGCSDVISEVNPGYEFISYIDSFPYYSDSTNQLSKTQFNYLFQSVDSLYGHNIWSLIPCCRKTKEKFYNSYLIYPGSFFSISEDILGFIVWIVDNDGIEKVLYTVDQKANIKDKLPLAFYNRHGSYTEEDGGRGVWWTDKSAVIFEDLKVKTDAGYHNDFEIKKNGMIKKI